MENISLFKKLRLFREYWILKKRNQEVITNKTNGLNLRIDRAGRIYTVYSCPEEVKSYGPNYVQKNIRDYIGRAEKMFIDLGMIEYIGIRDISQLNELDYLIVFGFKGFDTASFFNRIRITVALSVIGLILYFLVF